MDTKKILTELAAVASSKELDSWYEAYLGKKGEITLASKGLSALSPEEKKEMGQKLSEAKKSVTEAYELRAVEFQREAINAQLADDIVDISLEKPLSAA